MTAGESGAGQRRGDKHRLHLRCPPVYTLLDKKGGGRPGWSFLFESGRHDGFSPDEVELRLEITGERCREVADYEFTSVLHLMTDFRRGRFAPAFQTVQRATVH